MSGPLALRRPLLPRWAFLAQHAFEVTASPRTTALTRAAVDFAPLAAASHGGAGWRSSPPPDGDSARAGEMAPCAVVTGDVGTGELGSEADPVISDLVACLEAPRARLDALAT